MPGTCEFRDSFEVGGGVDDVVAGARGEGVGEAVGDGVGEGVGVGVGASAIFGVEIFGKTDPFKTPAANNTKSSEAKIPP